MASELAFPGVPCRSLAVRVTASAKTPTLGRRPISATAAALQELIDLDLDVIAAVQPLLGYGRD
ncbi:MAG: hypothetical protein ACREFN_18835 [Acetobacteraceae bacterium]